MSSAANASRVSKITEVDLARKIAKACLLDGELTPDGLVKGLDAGAYQQWHRNGTVLLTKLMTGELGPGCRIVLAAGDLGDVWTLHDEQAVPFAREQGREYMIGDGRRGWVKGAEARGYKEHGYRTNAAGNEVIQMVKDL